MSLNSIFTQITNMSLTAGVIILFVLLFRRLFKNTPKVFSYVLWAVVLFRLVCPVSFSSSISLLGVFDAPKVETGRMTSSVEYVSPDVYVAYREVHTPTPRVSESAVVQAEPETKVSASPMDIIICVWVAGILVMAGYSAVSYIKLKRRLMAVMHLRDNIYLADHIESAFVMGLVRPKIYLPSSLTETEQEYIIMHEQHHIRRCDHVMKFISFAALCVHWFNPLVWVAFIQSGKDMEMSCDEAVIKKMGEGIRAEYSASLLSLSMGRRIIAGTPLAFSEGNAKRRIINLANWKRPKTWVCIIVAISCILFTVACGTNPQSVANPPKAEQVTKEESLEKNRTDNENKTEETVFAQKTETLKETVYGTGTLVDDIPKPERNVLFKTVETPYDFFSRVTKEDVDGIVFDANGYSAISDLDDVDKVIDILNGIKVDEIQEDYDISKTEMHEDITACLELHCDDVRVTLTYKDEAIYLLFAAYTVETESGWELAFEEADNSNLYGSYKWQIENEALTELFEKAVETSGGENGPQIIDLTDEVFTVDGEDLGKYLFRTDLQIIILEIDDPSGVFHGAFCVETHGTGGSVCFVETEEEGMEIYEIAPVFPKYEYRLSGEDLEGCTVTLSSKDRF